MSGSQTAVSLGKPAKWRENRAPPQGLEINFKKEIVMNTVEDIAAQRRTKPPVTPLMEAILAGGPTHSFRIRFCTSKVGPERLPAFAYMASALTPTNVTYTAVVHDTEMWKATAQITDAWADATILQVEQGASAFREEDRMPGCAILGSYKADAPKKRFWGSL
jgi:hypothetical protein